MRRAGVQHLLDERSHVLVHLGLRGKRHGRRLVIRAFAQTQVRHAFINQRGYVLLAAIEVSLDDHAHARMQVAQAAVEVKCATGDGGVFHINAHKAADLRGFVHNPAHIGEAKIIADMQPHRRQLDRDPGREAVGLNGVEQAQVFIGIVAGLRFAGDIFAQVIHRRGDSLAVELANGFDSLLAFFASHKTSRRLARQRKSHNQPLGLFAVRQGQENRTHHTHRCPSPFGLTNSHRRIIQQPAVSGCLTQ